MGEESIPDPNQAQPPKEREAGHIEVAYHDDSQQAGEGVEPAAESVETSQAPAEDSEPAHLGSIDHADNSTQLTPEEEQLSPGRIRNKEKAEAMAHAEYLRGHHGPGYKDGGARHRQLNGESIKRSVEEAGDEYEVRALAERDGKTPEQVRELLFSNRKAFLDYSRAMIENQTKYGEKLSPNHVVLEAVHELATRYPDLIKKGYLDGHNDRHHMVIKIKHSRIVGGALDVNVDYYGMSSEDSISEEAWTAPAFNSVDSWRKYKVTSLSNQDPDFEFTQTTKSRTMREEDADRIKDIFADFRPELEDDEDDYYDPRDDEDDGVLRPGDEGYEDALREEHYGRDGTNGKSYLEENYGIKP